MKWLDGPPRCGGPDAEPLEEAMEVFQSTVTLLLACRCSGLVTALMHGSVGVPLRCVRADLVFWRPLTLEDPKALPCHKDCGSGFDHLLLPRRCGYRGTSSSRGLETSDYMRLRILLGSFSLGEHGRQALTHCQIPNVLSRHCDRTVNDFQSLTGPPTFCTWGRASTDPS